jgi:cytochrome c oxidase subunit I
VLAAPLLALQDTTGVFYRQAFTRLMQWGIFPPVLVALGLCAHALRTGVREGRRPFSDPRTWGFLASVGLCLLGFVLGALIRGSNTLVPAHYHAAIGALTCAFMAATYALYPELRLQLRARFEQRTSRWQPVLFAAGQAVFAVGFGVAGAYGADRKAYGAEQLQRTLPESIGLAVMALGGLVASLAGLLFLWIVFTSWQRGRAAAQDALIERSSPWRPQSPSTP